MESRTAHAFANAFDRLAHCFYQGGDDYHADDRRAWIVMAITIVVRPAGKFAAGKHKIDFKDRELVLVSCGE
jgi:hypothetical protein